MNSDSVVKKPSVDPPQSSSGFPPKLPKYKRALDLTILLLLSPALLFVGSIIALCIKVLSKGPVFFKQKRVGYREQPFLCYKFRTMHLNADSNPHANYVKELMQSSQPMTKMDMKKDSRLIPFGSIIRATGLDELPQVINILKGEMSLIGPRPCTEYEHENYLTWQKERFDILPGITGLWQVSGKNNTTFNEMIQFDIHYKEHAHFWLDLKILALTLPVSFFQTSAFFRLKISQQLPPPPSGPLALDKLGTSAALSRERN